MTFEVHTENGVHVPPEPGGWRRSALIALLVVTAILGAGILLWMSGIADASAPGGCGGG